jgi:hypothetical protein
MDGTYTCSMDEASVKHKIHKFALERATKAQRGNTGRVLLFI